MKLTEWQKFLEGRIWKIELEDGSVESTIGMSAKIFQGDGEASVMFYTSSLYWMGIWGEGSLH